jgi:class 3 adenylate cyclase
MDHLAWAATAKKLGSYAGLRSAGPLPALGAAIALLLFFRWVLRPLLRSRPRPRARAPAPRPVIPPPAPAPKGREAPLVVDSEEKRQELLKTHREIISALGSARRTHCVLLAIDVVGSTRMKSGESESKVAASFASYRAFVEKVLGEHEVWKQAWTPDGVMCCFLSRELALAAVQDLLKRLPDFNERENQLSEPFSVRCGMNEGDLAVFADSELEKIADRVIDVAGHMQKEARKNTVWVPDFLYRELVNPRGFRATAKEVDGYEPYEWAIRD